MSHGETVSSTNQSHRKHKIKWSTTVMMNARDLSRDDDFLSYLLVERLGTADSPLQVHKMDPTRRLPVHNPVQILDIVKKYIVRKGGASTNTYRIKRAVDALLQLSPVRAYLHRRSTAQINAFATHASRYFELYLPTGSIEISHTSRYSHRTGKSELCILATTPLKVGQVITDLKGSLAHLTVEEDEELKRTDVRSGGVRVGGRAVAGIRRDFSVIHSNQKNKSHLFLGPARFVNHDCDHNVELFRDGRVITFRVIKPISAGQEVTAHYGEGYFGKGNRHCLCETCEKHGRGGYAPLPQEGEGNETDIEHGDDSSTDEETREERIRQGLGLTAKGNPNERRTRRGVYAILDERESDDEEVAAGKENNVAVPGSFGTATVDPNVLGAVSATAGNASLIRRLSDAASSLTSLSDNEKNAAPTSTAAPATKIVAVPLQNGLQTHNKILTESRSAPLSRLSSVSSLSSPGPLPPTSASEASRVSTPSRIGTRSSIATASRTGTGHVSTSVTPNAKEVVTSASEKRMTRSSSNTHPRNHEKEKQPNMCNGTDTPTPTPTKPLEGKRSVSGKVQSLLQSRSKSKSKSSTPAAANVVPHPVVEKPHSLAPTCGMCGNEMPKPIAAGVHFNKGVEHTCARCKRHFAIFGSPWPDRLESLEAISASSSESSTNEKEHPHSPRKDKNGKVRIIDISHKRRKTDPALYVPGLHARRHSLSHHQLHHADYQPRNANGQFGSFSDRTNRHFKKFATDSGRASANSRSASIASVKLGKRKWDGSLLQSDDDDEEPDIRKTIRRLSFLPTPPALCSRPSPIVFAKSAWRISSFAGSDGFNDGSHPQADGDSGNDDVEEMKLERPGLKSLRSISRNASTSVSGFVSISSNLTPKSASGPSPASDRGAASASAAGSGICTRSRSMSSPVTNLKRKREPIIPEQRKAKQKAGRTFYRKNDNKPMPKGWVIITDSSEETCEEEEERGAECALPSKAAEADSHNHTPETGPATKSQVDDCLTLAAGLGSASVTASTPSLVHTPSSRADSTPAQGVRTPPDDQLNTPSAAAKTPKSPDSTAVDPPKSSSPPPSPPPDSPSLVTPKQRRNNDTENRNTPRTRSRTKQETSIKISEVDFVNPPLSLTKVESSTNVELNRTESPINAIETDSGNEETAVRELLVKPETWEITAMKSTPIAVTTSQATNPDPLIEEFTGLHILTPERKRAALEVSNIIHGTAFSYGHPDARTSWKPKYQYSEIDGWNLDTETFL